MHKQKGMSLIGILFIVATVCFYALLAAKLLPVYMENSTVKNILSSLQSKPEVTMSQESMATAARSAIQKNFLINNITQARVEDFTFTSTGNGIEIDASYEVRVNIINNIDAVIKFNNTARVTASGEK